MSQDQIFRIALIVSTAVFFPIAVAYRVRSQRSGEALDRMQEGLLILLTLRPAGVACMTGLIAYMIQPAWMAWSSLPLPAAVRWGGVGLGMAAGLWILWTFHTLGKNLTDTVVTRKEHFLITHGPYRWVRHPFYVGSALAFLANSLTTANWFIFATGAAAITLLVLRTRKEEAHLLARFGDQYRQYMESTGRFFPKFRR